MRCSSVLAKDQEGMSAQLQEVPETWSFLYEEMIMKNLTEASLLCLKSSAIWWWSGSINLSIDLTEDNDKNLTHLHSHTHRHTTSLLKELFLVFFRKSQNSPQFVDNCCHGHKHAPSNRCHA
jgi:ABC-type nickel/cobalt efflux system permease component RcnA